MPRFEITLRNPVSYIIEAKDEETALNVMGERILVDLQDINDIDDFIIAKPVHDPKLFTDYIVNEKGELDDPTFPETSCTLNHDHAIEPNLCVFHD